MAIRVISRILVIAVMHMLASSASIAQEVSSLGSTQITASPSALSFGNQKINSFSAAQMVTFFNPSSTAIKYSFTITGTDSQDFLSVYTNDTLSYGQVVIAFLPRFPGPKSASINAIDADTNTVLAAVPLSGNAVLSGTFQIVSSMGKALDLASTQAANGTLLKQGFLTGTPSQQWYFKPSNAGFYTIVNASSQKVLDVINQSHANGELLQQSDDRGVENQQWQLEPVDDVHYAIVNRLSGKVLDVKDGSWSSGAAIQQWDYLNNPQQLWVLVPSEPYMLSNIMSGQVLDVVNGSTNDRALVQQWPRNPNRQQQWFLVPLGGGFYAILSRLSGRALDVIDLSLENGTRIQQFEYLGEANQQWQLQPQVARSTHQFVLSMIDFAIINRQSGKALDDTNRSFAGGNLIQQYDYLSGYNQQWQLVRIPFYNIQNVLSGLLLDVPGGSSASGTTIQQWQSNGNLQQDWQVLPIDSGLSGGLYPFHQFEGLPSGPCVLVNFATGKVLEVAGASLSNNASADQADYAGASEQQWTLDVMGSTQWFNTNLYKIRNVNSDKVLDVTNFSLSNGAAIQQFTYLGGLNQQWWFFPVP